MTRVWRALGSGEKALAIGAISVMSLLPVVEMVARLLGLTGIPGSVVFVQQLTLWVAFLGAALAAGGDRLLSLSANTFLPEKWAGPVRIFGCGLTAAIAASLCWASYQFVVSERTGGKMLALGVPSWVPAVVMPVGFLLVAIRAIRGAGPKTVNRLYAALFLLVPLALAFTPQPQGSLVLWIGIPVIVAGAVLGPPIFATLGGVALLLLWSVGQPAATVPDNAYSLMSSEVLPSLPLYTLAGYLLVEGGASVRLLRVYTALFGWLPGGLAITTAVGCAIFTWAGSGVTIVSMGGLLLPMLMKARYPERFSIGLINGSGSLGLLFPPSLPVILYAVYAKNVHIDSLFVGGFVPGLLMVSMVSSVAISGDGPPTCGLKNSRTAIGTRCISRRRRRRSGDRPPLPTTAPRRVQMHRRAEVVRIGLSERQLRREQLAIGLDDLEVGSVADLISRERDLARAPQRIDLTRLLALLFPQLLIGDQRIGHILEGRLHRLLVLIQRLALTGVGEFDLVEVCLHAEQRLDQPHAGTPFGGRCGEQLVERYRQRAGAAGQRDVRTTSCL